MLLVSALPSLAGVIIVDQLLRDTIALGLNQRVGDTLDDATEVYRQYIELRKHTMLLQTRDLARDPRLARLLAEAPSEERARQLKALLARQARVMSSDAQGVAQLRVLAASEDTDAPKAGGLEVAVDRHHLYPEADWRAKPTALPLTAPDGARYRLEVTYVVPWGLFKGFQELGAVRNTYTNLGDQQASLAQGYSRTFLAVTGTIFIITIVLGVLLARATTRRLGLLAQGTTRVAAGDLEVALPVQGEDEIAHLTDAFNVMVVELRQARHRLTYLERVSTWQEIARRLAHEIKNPLTPIQLAVQQLDRKFDDYVDRPERYRRLVTDSMEIVTEEVEELGKLVREFSDFARLPQVEPQPICVGDYVRDLLRHNPQYADALTAEEPLDRSDGALAGIDATMMRRALVNLLDNACEALAEAGMPREDSVSVQITLPAPDVVAIVIEDQGPGVPADLQPNLFDPYFTTKADGTGLGLAIVRKIVIDHGGDITVRSPVTPDGAGTQMIVELPRLGSDEG